MNIADIIDRARAQWDTAEQLSSINGVTGKTTPRQVVYLGTRATDGFSGITIQINGTGPSVSGTEAAALVAHALREVLWPGTDPTG